MTRWLGLEKSSGQGEAGSSTPFTLLLGTALIVMPVMILVLSIPVWEQRAVDARDAARAAALALATATTWQSGVETADEVVAQIAAQNGIPGADLGTDYEGSLAPGSLVSATVSVAVPVGDLPGLGDVGTLHYSASSVEHVDSYRGDQ
ncbi:MAG TPA: hypothetical protein VME20_12325 [Acidimicrobiales bacterium]|nr:hypothetical protein [Acidimicrobiales bacterium]